jgi:hypothetical protein
MPDMHHCPPQFSSTLAEFVEHHVKPNLLSKEGVEGFHNGLMQYIKSRDSIYILREMKDTVRFRRGIDENIYSTNEGVQFKTSDNHPAWWIHHLIFHGYKFTPNDRFKRLIDDIPTHFFSIPGPSITSRRSGTINAYGYHLAHIYNVKDGNIDYRTYSKQEMVKRFIRNIHPLNYFYIANEQWRKYGETKEMRSFFVTLFSHKYPDLWDEFIKKAQPTKAEENELIYDDSHASFRYCYSPKDNTGGFLPSGRFVLVENVPTMMIDVNWTDYGGWKPWQYQSDMDQLAQTPNSKVRFNLLKGGIQKYCIEMDIDQWKGAMERHMETPYWITHGSFWIPFTKRRNGKFTEEFKPNWKPYVKKCPCENVVYTICKPEN